MSGNLNNGADVSALNEQINLIHLSLIYLSDKFKVEENQNDLIRYLQAVFTKQVDNPHYNPYYNYSDKVKKEVDEMMTIRESFEARGEARGVIWLMLGEGKSDSEIIKRLGVLERNPLTEKQAREALDAYRKGEL